MNAKELHRLSRLTYPHVCGKLDYRNIDSTLIMTTDAPISESEPNFHAVVDYEDPYVQPLIISALAKHLPSSSYKLITALSKLPSSTSRILQFLQYESIDFEHILAHPATSLANAYVIRKALIRKHYLSHTVSNWVTKYPESPLKNHVKPSVEFEVDYAEFLDDALVEAWDLKESWARGVDDNGLEKAKEDREWWILKPGMSDRGQGIRMFSNEEELTAIFEEWDPPSDHEDEDGTARSDHNGDDPTSASEEGHGIITSQLRHFVAQPYIHPPLLFPSPSSTSTDPSALRKFHIRTYVLAVGALKVHVYKPMLALFAAGPYVPPWESTNDAKGLSAHLTNTCLQGTKESEGNVALFWDLPSDFPPQLPCASASLQPDPHWKDHVFSQICTTTAEVFNAAARSMSIHFQPLPNAFEIFGLDFLVGIEPNGELRAYLLEVNAFPDFRQTGDELKGLVEGLFEGVVGVSIKPFFGLGKGEAVSERDADFGFEQVLDIDLGRR
ncbi:tubulin-tyrosine ligase family-domain-containing protein [Massariosphaeria phaeospora]|uniref:Tubulin-tyrosine ligase family-domain-containing protein n=1 Tax=Massariosphaeria phaeospora TaxID=100035 RepID=A0A7C8M6B6_9PLEO|nr:tubulin-tyrosine ligase family-domain-containing protein [Massariosphaeria phaeospora]